MMATIRGPTRKSVDTPLGEANPFLPNRGFQTQADWVPLLAHRRLAFCTSCEVHFQGWGKTWFLEIFSQGLFPQSWG